MGQRSELATRDDGRDLQDALNVNYGHCNGMAANMISVKKNIIIVNMWTLTL